MSNKRGLRNNNYLNVKQPLPDIWRDAGGKDSLADSENHAIFTDPAYGLRAAIIQLRSYFFRPDPPLRSVAAILSRWAPVSDTLGSLPGWPPNSPEAYARHVAKVMGISPTERLRLFKADQSLGDLEQLRNLLRAMAEYEIESGFIIPSVALEASLELVQRGILEHGTDSQATNHTLTLTESDPQLPDTLWRITSSVGVGGVNAKSSVTTVQELLTLVATILEDFRYSPGDADGKINANVAKSPTVQAIRAFQRRFLVNPDGLIEVDGRTWRELLLVAEAGPDPDLTEDLLTRPSTPFFPFARLPTANWTSAPRKFGARRAGGSRAHAACDLYSPAGTTIYAISDGTVTRGPSPFYKGTYSLEIDHGAFLARYCEIDATTRIEAGDTVRAGQPIARVGHLVGITVASDMLHLELYDKSASGPLSVGAATSARDSSGVPYHRRRDLIDPTPFLDQWKNNLPGIAAPDIRTDTGFCIKLTRLRQEYRADLKMSRTISRYECEWNGHPIPALTGQMVEPHGPGNNTALVGDNDNRRIREGTYRLAIQDGALYRTYRYTKGKDRPRPGILLEDTQPRYAIIIHPGENFMNSEGCLNPASGLQDAASQINFADSRARVIAIIDDLKTRLGSKFPKTGTIPDATIVITGEPV